MIPEVGTTCRFTFIQKFSTLNSVYRIQAETTFRSAIASGIDFIAHLYTPAGLQQSDFATDYAGYDKDRIAVLESVYDSSIIYYCPESIFATVPDPTITEYLPLTLVVNLGVQKNTQAVLPLLDAIKDLVRSTIGSTDPVKVVTNTAKKIYLTDSEYAVIQVARAANIQALIPLSIQLKQEQDRNTYLAARLAAVENLLITQATS